MSATCTASTSCRTRRPTGAEAKALCATPAQKALAGEIEARAERFSAAADASLVLSNDGTVRWHGRPGGEARAGRQAVRAAPAPRRRRAARPARRATRSRRRLKAWLKAHIVRLLGPLLQLEESPSSTGHRPRHRLPDRRGARRARALAGAAGGARPRPGRPRGAAQARRALRRLSPLPAGAPEAGAAHARGAALGAEARRARAEGHRRDRPSRRAPAAPRSRSIRTIAKGLYRAAGFRVCGGRAVRVDILERLADLIRPAIAYRPGLTPGEPPPGAADDEGFVADGRHDLARRLLRRGFRLDPEIARLRRGPPARTGHHGAARGRARRRRRRSRRLPTGATQTAAAGDGQPAEAAPATTGESAATPEIGESPWRPTRPLDGAVPGRACPTGSGRLGERGRGGRCRSRHRTHRPVRDRRADGGRRGRRGGRSRGRGCRRGGGRRTGGRRRRSPSRPPSRSGACTAGITTALRPATDASAPVAPRAALAATRVRAESVRTGPSAGRAGPAGRTSAAPKRQTPLKPMPQEPRPGRRAARAAPTSVAERSGRGAAPRRGAATVRSRAAARSAATSRPTRTRPSPSCWPSRRSSKAATGTSAEEHRRPATPASSAGL